MARFQIGEEVLYQGERFMVAGVFDRGPYRYRLLASGPDGARVVWAREEQLEPIESYLHPRDDTAAA